MTDTSATTIELNAPIEKVQSVLVRAMKPGRTIVSAVRFKDGSVEEFRESRDDKDGKVATPYREAAPTPLEPEKTVEPVVAAKALEKAKEATAAVSVAKPTIGCPLPDFAVADVKATRVLETFLDEQQLNDFRKDNSFITVGGDTHHRYLVCSRHASKRVKEVTRGWQVLDLDEDQTFCVHDWTSPAAEELLTLHLFLSMTGREHYVRGLH